MHSSVTFSTMKSKAKNCDILASVTGETFNFVRKLIIEMILETDMSKHFDALGKFRSKFLSVNNQADWEKVDDKLIILKTAIKCADIGHSAKSWDLHHKWSMKVVEEFFRQGDIERERGQAISMYCDRESTIVSKSQAGFLSVICEPLFKAFN